MTYGHIIAIIQCYIHHTKGIEVQINLPRNVKEIKLMQQMYEVAKNHIR